MNKITHNGKTYTEASPSSIWRENQRYFREHHNELIHHKRGFIITYNNSLYPGIKVWGNSEKNKTMVIETFKSLQAAKDFIDNAIEQEQKT